MAEGTSVAPAPADDPSAELSEAEQDVVRAVLAGEQADGKRRIVRASVVRDLVLERRPGWQLPPVGIRLNRVIIQGCLDLEGCTLSKPFLIWHSRFEGGGDKGALVIRDGRLKRLGIHSCTVLGNVIADRVEIENGLFMGGGKVAGALYVRGGTIGGALAIDGTELGNGTAALLGAGVSISGPLIIRRAKISGEVAIPRANLNAGIYAEDMKLAFDGIALNAESAKIRGDVLMDRAEIEGGVSLQNVRLTGRLAADAIVVSRFPVAIDASGLNVTNGISMQHGRLKGSLVLDGAEVGKAFRAEALDINGNETAISADVIKVAGNWELPRARLLGQLRCPGTEIEGQLRMTEISIFGKEIAIRADGARIRGGCYMSRSVITGLVRLPAADIGNQFRLRSATIKVEQGAALLAPGATFRRDVELDKGFQTVGAVILDHAVISGALTLETSHLMSAAIARSGRGQKIRDAWRSTDGDELALSLVDAQVDRLVMPDRADERPRGIVDLSRAHVGSFLDFADTWPPPPAKRTMSEDGRDIDHLVLDGLSYEHLSNPSGARAPSGAGRHSRSDDRVAQRRIAWLESQPECDVRDHFKPQAWVTLADRLAQQGYLEDARRIDIARARGERRSHAATSASRWQSRLLDWFALYGHNPWRTILWMTIVVLLFAGVWSWAARQCTTLECFDERVFVVTHRDSYTPETFSTSYPAFNPLAYSFDVFVPFVSFGYEDHWRPNMNWGPIAELPLPSELAFTRPDGKPISTIAITWGGILYVLTVLEAILGLVLTSLAVTGFTGLLRGRSGERGSL